MDQIWEVVIKICKAIFYAIAVPCVAFVAGILIAIDMIRITFTFDDDGEDHEFTWFNKLKTLLGADDD